MALESFVWSRIKEGGVLTYESVLSEPGLKATFFKKMDNSVFV